MISNQDLSAFLANAIQQAKPKPLGNTKVCKTDRRSFWCEAMGELEVSEQEESHSEPPEDESGNNSRSRWKDAFRSEEITADMLKYAKEKLAMQEEQEKEEMKERLSATAGVIPPTVHSTAKQEVSHKVYNDGSHMLWEYGKLPTGFKN